MPLDEVGVLITSHPAVSCTAALLAGVSAAGGSIVVCDDRRLPVGMMLPLQANTLQSERIASQVGAKLPLRKRLWQQVVSCKLRAQAATLELETGADAGLALMAKHVRSGDPENLEARAARRYWTLIFGDPDFRRDRGLEGTNAVLNYGYTVLRAMTARAICGAGLHPSIGLHHHNRYSQFVLADDLMEPFRPVVDRAALQIRNATGGEPDVTKESKAILFEHLNARYRMHDQERTLFDVLVRVATSLAETFAGSSERLDLPGFPEFFLDGADQA